MDSVKFNNIRKRHIYLVVFLYSIIIVQFSIIERNFLINKQIYNFLLILLVTIIISIIILFLLNYKLPYSMEIENTSRTLSINAFSGNTVYKCSLCTLRLPVINLKDIWWNEFLEKNKKVHLVIEDDKNKRPLVIGKGFFSYGMIPMREAVEIENWIKEWKKKLCETNTNKGGDER